MYLIGRSNRGLPQPHQSKRCYPVAGGYFTFAECEHLRTQVAQYSLRFSSSFNSHVVLLDFQRGRDRFSRLWRSNIGHQQQLRTYLVSKGEESSDGLTQKL